MSRLPLFAALSASILTSQTLAAQEAAPQTPFDLARALRDSDQPDLALDYLDDCAKTLPPEWQVTLPIERAKARIRLAAPETDEVKRDTLVNAAKGELEQFLKANTGHPRAAEAAMALANVASLQGKSQLRLALRIPDIAGRRAAGALARPFFVDASAKFLAAAKAQEESVNLAGSPEQKRDLTRELYQTILDQGINRYYLGDSYILATEKADIEARSLAYKDAQVIFSKLGNRKPENAISWIAKAWAGECYYATSERANAEAAFAALRTAAGANPNGPALAGVRQARFFEIQDKWGQLQSAESNPAAPLVKFKQLCESWLADYRTFRVTTETYAVTFYSAMTKYDEAKLGVRVDPKTMAVIVNPNVLSLLKEADRDFRRLADAETEYTARAAKMRPQVIRLIVGNADKQPQEIATFEECHLTSLVQLDKLQQMSADPKVTPAEKQTQIARVIELLEREKRLPVPKESLRDSLNSQVMLVYVYRISNRAYQAAVLGEYLAHASKGPTAAKAGLNAMMAYLESVDKCDPADTASRALDSAKALSLAYYLDTAIPDDAGTDEARFQAARMLVQNSRYIEAFNILNRITARYPNLTRARLMQGGIAYELLRPRAAGSTPPKFALPAEPQKPAIFKLATTDLAAVPVANPATVAPVAIDYCRVQNQLAQIYLTNAAGGGYPMAEKIGGDVAALIPTLAKLPAVEKETLPMEAEMTRINAVYGQAMPLYQQKKYKESADRYAATIAAIEKAGPAVKAPQDATVTITAKRLDELRLSKIVVPALNSRVAAGQLDEAGKLLDMLKRLGSSQDQIVNAVFQVVMASKPQIDQLKKEGKADEAGKVSANLSALAGRISGAEAKLTPVQLLDLGKIFKELGDYEKGAALLLRIPAPANAAFLKAEPPQPPASEPTDAPPVKKGKDDALAAWTADKAATPYYRVAQLELLRTYRLAGQLPKAEELLGGILGKDKERKTGWGSSIPDYRKEGFLFLEAKAAGTADMKEATKLWLEAKTGWEALAREYYGLLIKPIKADANAAEKARLDQQKSLAKPIYFDLIAESIRCLAQAQLHVNAGNLPAQQKVMDNLGKKIADLEKKNPDLNDDVRAKLRKLLDDVPPLREPYKVAGGEWLNPPK